MKAFLLHWRWLWAALLLSVSAAAFAADNSPQQADRQLKSWETELERWLERNPGIDALAERQTENLALRQQAEVCVEARQVELADVQERLDALGEAREDEPDDLKKLRRETQGQHELLTGQLALCRLLVVRSRALGSELKALRSAIAVDVLGQRGEAGWMPLVRVLESREYIRPGSLNPYDWMSAAIAGALTLAVLLPIATFLARLLRRSYPEPEPPASWSVGVLFANMLARRLVWVAGIAALGLAAYFAEARILSAVLLALLLSLMIAPLIEMLLCQSVHRCVGGLPTRVLLDLLLIGLSLHLADAGAVLTEDGRLGSGLVYVSLVALVSEWLLFALARRPDMGLLRALRIPLAIALMAGPVALWLGYRPLAILLNLGVYGTLGGLLLLWMLYQPLSHMLLMLDVDSDQRSEGLREFLGYKAGEQVPGLRLGRLMLWLLSGSAFIYWALISWNVREDSLAALKAGITDGFEVGSITIVPGRLLVALLVFLLVLTLARWLRSQLADRWLTHTRLDSGARQSIVSLTSYTIIGIALLMSLSMAGVDFQNLAIVAGALSVGIGFGLQNIVNNFVSGLILLFERPVKPGDWIVVGATEGHVQRVSIRYTQIRTFDRADVLVPNSELISTQVTNWMLRDSIGRVVVQVGVAYGTDTAKVMQILEKIGNEHPQILTKARGVPPPKVIFMAFGASSLDFELRAFVRDVDQRLQVRSELMLAVDQAFREANIEIPFPQRVVHFPDKPQAPDEQPPGDSPG